MSFPNFTFWSHLLAIVGVEVCCLAALGFVAQLFFRSAVWQRAVWQMAVICLLLLPASEWTGFGRGTAGFLFGHKRVVENAPTPGFTVFKSTVAGGPVTAKLQLPSLASRPAVWWPAWVWLAGMIVVLGRMAAAQVLLLALRWRREKIATHSLRERVACVARSVGLRRKVSLLRMPKAISPMAFGILRPSIGLPPGFEAKWSATEQEAVLAHELAHLAAMDPLWFLLADCASAWLWWHPLVWWVRRSLHGAAELAADEATAMVPDGPGALANCLVSLGKEMTAARGWSWVGINGGFRSKLGKRVERLMRMSGGARRPMAGWLGAATKLAATILVVPTIVLLFGSFQSAHAQKEDSWRDQLRQSWNSSPGALLVLAALEDAQSKKEDIATRLQKGKLLYEMHRYDEAEAILLQIVKDDPTNHSAPYYLDLIKEVRYMDSARKRGVEPLPRPVASLRVVGTNLVYFFADSDVGAPISAPLPLPRFRIRQMASASGESVKQTLVVGGTNSQTFNTNLVFTTKGRQYILSKLNNIMLDEVSFDLPLKDVLLKLRTESQKRDPDGIGVNFMISQNVEGPTLSPNDPSAGAHQQKDIGTDVTIKISPPLRHVRLADVLDAIATVADSPIRYTVKDYTVVFSPKLAETNPGLVLYSKTFRVDTTMFVQALQKVTGVTLNFGAQLGSSNVRRTNSTVELHQLVSDYFAALGVDLTPPKAVFFNDRLGELLVRATLADLELIEPAIEKLNRTPPQVTIEARFAELSQTESQGLGLNSYLGSTPLSNGVVGLKAGTAPPIQAPSTFAEPSGIFPGQSSVVPPGTTPDTSASVVVTATALNGILSDAEFRTLITAIEKSTGADILSAPKVTTESGRQAHFGVADGNNSVGLDVIVEVGPDGFSIQTAAIASIKRGAQTWQFSASHKVWDGQTLVFSGVMTNQAPGVRKEMMVLVTPRIIDPAGNPVHTDEDISKRPGRP
jgi:beta-lactamase regulating signal transducer with metallopeptidase domain